jgi:hypothetical protein
MPLFIEMLQMARSFRELEPLASSLPQGVLQNDIKNPPLAVEPGEMHVIDPLTGYNLDRGGILIYIIEKKDFSVGQIAGRFS